MRDDQFVTAPGGVRLRVRRSEPSGAARRLTVVVATGRTEFIEKYGETVGHLGALGYRTLVFDWRGQGRSSRLLADPQKGHVDDYHRYLADLDTVLGVAGGAPVAILGHSMGGHVALRALARWPGRVRGAVLSAPMVAILGAGRFAALAEVMAAGGGAGAYVWGRGGYGVGDTVFAGNKLTHDRARFQRMVDAVAADPTLAIGGPTWGWLRASLRSIAALRREGAAITDPVLMVGAGGDRIVDNAAQAALAGQLARGRLVSVAGAEHELLQEADEYRLAFWREAEPWLAGLDG